MQAVKRVEGTGAPLDRTDVDTDAIIPAMCMKRVERTGFEDGLFFEWKKDPEFVLNQPEYQGASVLVAGPNFGCGSSREHAAWALQDGGFRAVISPSFGDIFRENSLKVGLLAITLQTATVDTLLRAVERLPSLLIHIDVEALTVSAPSAGIDSRFELDEFMRWRLLEGVDDIALTLTHDEALRGYDRSRDAWLPSISKARN